MDNKFFLHQMKHTNGTYEKGIVVKDSFDDALQGFHSYLGAYAYGKDKNTDFVDCMITESGSQAILVREQWVKAVTE